MDDRSDFGRFDSGPGGWDTEPVAAAHQRLANRDSMFLQARIVRRGCPDLTLRVRNLSSGGMMAETGDAFAVGDAVQVELRTIGLIEARVAWVRSSRIGIAFDRPVDPKLARKAPPQSPGAGLMLVPKVQASKRPAVRGDRF